MNTKMCKLFVMVVITALAGQQIWSAEQGWSVQNYLPTLQSNTYRYAPYLLGGAALGAGLGYGMGTLAGYAESPVYKYALISGILGLLGSGAYRYRSLAQEQAKAAQAAANESTGAAPKRAAESELEFASYFASWIKQPARHGGVVCNIKKYRDATSGTYREEFKFQVVGPSLAHLASYPKNMPIFNRDESRPGIVPIVPRIIKAFEDGKINVESLQSVNQALVAAVKYFDSDNVNITTVPSSPTDTSFRDKSQKVKDANIIFLGRLFRAYAAPHSGKKYNALIDQVRQGSRSIVDVVGDIQRSLNKKENNQLRVDDIM